MYIKSLVRFIYLLQLKQTQPQKTKKMISQIQEEVNEMRRNRVQKELLACMSNDYIKKFQISYKNVFAWELNYIGNLTNAENSITRTRDQQTIIPLCIYFNKNYPFEPPLVKFNKRVEHTKITKEYQLSCNLLGKFWSLNIPMVLVLKEIIQIIQSKEFKIIRIQPFIIERKSFIPLQKQSQSVNEQISYEQENKNTGRQYSIKNTTTQTKNLNRHFRSKLRQILREQMKISKNDSRVKQLYQFFKPNRVGFKQIRKALQQDWFNQILKRELKSGEFLRRILNSIMNIESKHLMLKYYPIIEQAVNQPNLFSRWKY